MASEAVQLDAVAKVLILRQQPMVAGLSGVMFNATLGLGDQQVLLQGRE